MTKNPHTNKTLNTHALTLLLPDLDKSLTDTLTRFTENCWNCWGCRKSLELLGLPCRNSLDLLALPQAAGSAHAAANCWICSCCRCVDRDRVWLLLVRVAAARASLLLVRVDAAHASSIHGSLLLN